MLSAARAGLCSPENVHSLSTLSVSPCLSDLKLRSCDPQQPGESSFASRLPRPALTGLPLPRFRSYRVCQQIMQPPLATTRGPELLLAQPHHRRRAAEPCLCSSARSCCSN